MMALGGDSTHAPKASRTTEFNLERRLKAAA